MKTLFGEIRWWAGREDERELTQVELFEQNRCPNCRTEDSVMSGPTGGMCQNMACVACGYKFNTPSFTDTFDHIGWFSDMEINLYRDKIKYKGPEMREGVALDQDQFEESFGSVPAPSCPHIASKKHWFSSMLLNFRF